jgi:hypothetical protein
MSGVASNLSVFAAILTFVTVATLLPGSLSQPAGLYNVEGIFDSSNCTTASLTDVYIYRLGPELCRGNLLGSSYRSCNATNVIQYQCATSDCSGACEIQSSTL